MVGRIGKPHGLRGEVTVEVRTDEPDRRFARRHAVRAERPSGAGSALDRADRRRDPLAPVHAAGPLRGAARPHDRRGRPRPAAPRRRPGRRVARRPRGVLRPPARRASPPRTSTAAPLGEVDRPSSTAPRTSSRCAPPTAATPWCRSWPRWCPRSTSPAGRVVIADRPGLVTPFPEDEREPVVRIDVVTIFPAWFDSLDVSLTGKARASGPARHRRPRPARLDPRPAPHRRRHPLRRWRGDGDEAGAVGRGARRSSGATARPDARRADAERAPLHPGRRPRARRARPPGPRVRALRGHRPAGHRPRRHVVRRARSCRSATSCSTGERSPRWRSSRRSSGCCPVSWATPSPSPRSPTRTACWSTPSTPSPPPGAATTYLRCCSPATTRPSPPGVTPSRYAAPSPAAPTSPTPRRRSGSATSTLDIPPATRADAGELFTLTRACWLQELWANPGVADPGAGGVLRRPPRQPRRLDDVRGAGRRADGRLVARPCARANVWDVGRVMVAPDLQGRGLGRYLLDPDRGGRPGGGHVVPAVHRAPAASTTSGCTRRPATGCAVRPRVPRAP